MWVFTRHGFFSAVHKNCAQDELVIRSRVKEDLAKMLTAIANKTPIVTGAGTDYLYRVVVSKKDWGNYLATESEMLDYSNFKAQLPPNDRVRHDAYMNVWADLLELEDRSAPSPPRRPPRTRKR